MKKKLNLAAVVSLFISILVPTSLSAIVEFGADGGYISQSVTATATSGSTSVSQSVDYSGYLAGGYAHLTFGIPSLLTVGVGPQVAFSGQSAKTLQTGLNKDNLSYTRIGADIKFQLEIIPVIKPFARFSLGKDIGTWTYAGPYSLSGVTYTREDTVSFGGLYYNALVGLQFSLMPLLSLYVQAGPTGGGKSTATLKSVTLNGTSAAFSQSNTVEMSYSGFLVAGGASLSF